MAAYAALVSVMQIIHQIQTHPFPPISLDEQQVDSLTEKVNLLQEFLEGYDSPFGYSDEADPLEMRIADAAYATEDVIESYIVDNIKLVAKTTHHDDDADAAAHDDDSDGDDAEVKEISCISFYEDVQKVIEEMDLLVKEVSEMVGKKAAVQRSVVSPDAAFGSISSERKSVMVGFDDMLLELLDRLTGGKSSRQIIPIVGMGGVGKTTLAINVFENQLIKEHFHICVWATISQNYDIQETLAQVLSQVRGNSVDKSEPDLGEKLYKFFCGRKYLIVMDDMWSLEVWDKLKFFFPEYNNGSRVLVTTRLTNLATHLTDSTSHLNVKSLDEISCWSLFSKTVFGEDSTFPRELEEIGNKIVKKCNGHPLAIVVIGGLLAKSQHTQEHWEDIEANLISRVNSENDEYCLRILRMSYNHLHVCLKPCFLYMGVFEEDREIYVSTLIKLWVSEGFVKPRDDKSLETIAEEYFKELLDRNLVLVAKLGSLGNIKYCKMHDLLRDLCLKEAEKQRFYYDLRGRDSPRGMSSQRRVVIRRSSSLAELCDVFESISHIRSILCDSQQCIELSSPDFRLLRILSAFTRESSMGQYYSIEDVFQYVNLRYIAVRMSNSDGKIPCSINWLWNLQAFTNSVSQLSIAPTEIWKMHQLRHFGSHAPQWYLPVPPRTNNAIVVMENLHQLRHLGRFGWSLPDPPRGDNDIVIMENLQTLRGVRNLNLNEEVVKRIPNIKKLGLVYDGERMETAKSCLSYLQYLSKLESFFCRIHDGGDEFLQNISFPKSLKKLTIWSSSCFEWEDILEKIGSLPLLQKLILARGVFRTGKWETIEGQFPSLKVLDLYACDDLKNCMVSESSHFPRLQELRLSRLHQLEEIPSEIGDIATLKSIVFNDCSTSLLLSAKKIVDEQVELQGEELDLHVRVVYHLRNSYKELRYLASPNFHFRSTNF